MPSRLALYGLGSTALFGIVVSSTLKARPNFYSAAVALGRSSGASLILANFALFNAIWLGVVLKTVFFGRLRSVEYEHLFERLWVFLTESLLALTIFRDDFSVGFAFMYGVLLFLKCFHWITSDRVDYMDQVPPPGPPILFHVRVVSILSLLAIADCILVSYSFDAILYEGVSAMVLFSSEFMILLAGAAGAAARYVVNVVDIRRARGREDAPVWEDKSVWLFYIDLAVDFVKLLTYMCFFVVILLHYGLPLHILRDVYMTLRSFLSRVSDLIRYRKATRDMDSLYPDASEEHVARDRVCIICREEMVAKASAAPSTGSGMEAEVNPAAAATGGPNETPKRLVCGHVFHFHCLRSWLERQQSCPTCRRDVLRTAPPSLGRQNTQPPPPAPAPGAVPPRPDANARPAPTTPLQAIYDQYFPPARPTDPPAIPAPTAGAASGAETPAVPDAARDSPAVPGPSSAGVVPPPPLSQTAPSPAQANQTDRALQRGIWGGPIVPGRFTAAPLGAAPRFGSPAAPVASLARYPYASSPPRLEQSTSSAAHPANGPLHIPSITTTAPVQDPSDGRSPQSGTTTPFSSQAPAIFSSPGSTKTAMDTETEESAQPEDPEVRARRERAEAAMRRLGVSTGRAHPSNGSALATSVTGTGIEQSDPLSGDDPRTSAKGKEKEWSPVRPVDDLHAASRAIPFLSPSGLSHLNDPIDWVTAPTTVAEVDAALAQRLQTLREVDEKVRALIADLTGVQGPAGTREDSVASIQPRTRENMSGQS